jgi:predicted extracellular nuclease
MGPSRETFVLTAHSSRLRRLPTAALAVLALMLSSLVAGALPARAASADLFFSEYVEGSSFNKAIEIYNGTGAPVNLGAYTLELYSNGSPTTGATRVLSGTLADGDVFVGAHSAADPAVLAVADDTVNGGVYNWNGDDAVVLRKAGTVVDSIGQVGSDPGAEWGTALTSTADNTLRRKDAVTAGDTNAGDVFDPSLEWDGFANNTFDGLGWHITPPEVAPTVSSTTPANDATGVELDADVTVRFSENVSVSGNWASITCSVSGAHPATTSGGPSTYVLDPTTDFVSGDVCTATVTAANVTDQDSNDPPDAMASDYSWSFRTITQSCTDPDTPVSTVQGPDATSPLSNTDVTVQAVVTAIRPGLSGFFVQEEESDQDTDPATSEGVFVRRVNPPASVREGDVVQVTGGVREFTGSGSSQTQISGGTIVVLDCGVAEGLPPAAVLSFPVADVSDFEHVEGMRVTMPQSLVISEYFNYGRFNEVVAGVPPNGRSRFDSPTAVQEPDPAATAALLADYAKRRITIDDGRGSQNASPPIFPGTVDTPFTLENSFRGGDTLTGVTGVVEHTFGLYRVHPTTDATYASVNPRPAAPPQVGGDLKVASFNVLNYFLTPDAIPTDDNNNNPADDVCGGNANLECRGADGDQPNELSRQRAKIVDAIATLDADVVGLMEMENTPGVEPAADLVDGLNAATAPGTYAFIDTGVIGTDAIRLGFLYQPGAVTPVGDFEVLDSSDDPRFDDTRSRPALAQTFQQVGTQERVTIAVNHLKSKGSACAGDPDTGDGSGNCNETRTLAAEALADWLATDPTASGDPDRLIIGDLNSYDHEEPVDALVDAGYTDLVKKYGGEFAYSYVFDGQVGYLDHGLASESLLPQVTGAGDWHINADEPSILDYDTSFKGPNEDALYEPNAFRSSDHDPVLIGLQLATRRSGKVTAGGWFDSPAGSAAADPAASGRTYFALHGHYAGLKKKLSGVAELRFPAADLAMSRGSVDWLLVEGRSALMRGAASVNREPGYEFQASLTDGPEDTVRIRILNPDHTVVYDSGVQVLKLRSGPGRGFVDIRG